MKLKLSHTTRYVYDAPLRGECFMEARVRPLDIPGVQVCQSFALTTDPSVPTYFFSQPGEGGTTHHFVLRGSSRPDVSVHAESVVETVNANPFAALDLLSEDWAQLTQTDLSQRMAEWLAPTPLVPVMHNGVGDWPAAAPTPSVLGFGQALSSSIFGSFEYVPGATDVSTPLSEFVRLRRGVCQDYAHLFLACARGAGVPARYVSGYIYAGGDAGTHGAGATHAWAELFLPHADAWVGFDPTNNVIVGDHHIKVAVGRDYNDVPPTKGLLRGLPGEPAPRELSLEVSVMVERTE